MKKYKSIIYTLKDISDGKGEAFEAHVIAPNGESAIVFGDSKKEIEEGIEGFLEYESLNVSNPSGILKAKKITRK